MPLVSIIIPCYNEQSTIQLLLESIYKQNTKRSDIEVIIADGMSTDRTREKVKEFSKEHPDLIIEIIDNPKRSIPAGLNCALNVAKGEFIIRLDAHSMPSEEYVRLCLNDLINGKGENVGGVWDIRPGNNSWIASAIAKAASHPLGVGDAKYRYATTAGYVDTVPFGSYTREIFNQFGKFNEDLLTNEDYEFNSRLRKSGGRIWFNPEIRSIYFARSSIGSLSQQYWRYGFWKWRMLRSYPKTLKLRQALPPLFVISIIGLVLLSFGWWQARSILIIELLVYILSLIAGTLINIDKKENNFLWIGIVLSIITMHISWGMGFLTSMFSIRNRES